ncbi:MAG: hypothetical protein GY847_32800 [Proteobacteria bacterium]|nr:hypothetical protein [Pseudomonadota bacterium]
MWCNSDFVEEFLQQLERLVGNADWGIFPPKRNTILSTEKAWVHLLSHVSLAVHDECVFETVDVGGSVYGTIESYFYANGDLALLTDFFETAIFFNNDGGTHLKLFDWLRYFVACVTVLSREQFADTTKTIDDLFAQVGRVICERGEWLNSVDAQLFYPTTRCCSRRCLLPVAIDTLSRLSPRRTNGYD